MMNEQIVNLQIIDDRCDLFTYVMVWTWTCTETVLLNSMGNGVIFREQASFADDHHVNKMKLPSYLNRCMIFTLTLLSAV